jgi:MEDS: MEthanogen/methylotroph, DcmR Sensory domain
MCVLFFPPMSTGPKFQPVHHAAKFYETESSLYATVANFLTAGFVAGQPAIVVATPSHTEAIERFLADRAIDVPRARRTGDMVVLDAEDTLGTFMISGHPDAELFEFHVGSILEQVLRGRRNSQVRAYGEMVDVLWKQGSADAAIELEILWNKLALKYAFSLLCGYSMGNFFKQAEQFHDVCRQHSHIIDPPIDEPGLAKDRPRLA